MFLVVYIGENIKSTPSSPPGRKHTNTNKTNIDYSREQFLSWEHLIFIFLNFPRKSFSRKERDAFEYNEGIPQNETDFGKRYFHKQQTPICSCGVILHI